MAYINGKKVLFSPKVNVTQIKVQGLDTSDMENLSYAASDDIFNDRLEYINTSSCKYFTGILSGCVELTEAPDWDTSKGESFNEMFLACEKLLVAPSYNLASGTSLSSMFRESGITEAPSYRLDNAQTVSRMFSNCTRLKKVGVLYTPQVRIYSRMFEGSTELETIEGITFSNVVTTTNGMFTGCENLKNLTISGEICMGINVSNSPLLTVESLLSIINALADVTGATTVYTLAIGEDNKAKLTEGQIAIALNKGWVVS